MKTKGGLVAGAIIYWQYNTGQTCTHLARLLGVTVQTLWYWRKNDYVGIRYQKRFLEITGIDPRMPPRMNDSNREEEQTR